MNHLSPRPRPGRLWLAGLAVLVLFAGAGVAGYVYYRSAPAEPPPPPPYASAPPAAEIDRKSLQNFCAACHPLPPPDTFPRSAWRQLVEQGYMFAGDASLNPKPPINQVLKYYEDRAPEELPPAQFENVSAPPPVRFEKVSFPTLPDCRPPRISNVNLVHLSDPRRLDVLACDMYTGRVMLLKPYEPAPRWEVLAKIPNPAHAEVVDLDGDGIPDILVANLGNFTPMDRLVGTVVWLRGQPDGHYKPYTLLKDVGRVADVQAADFRGTGKKDLIAGVFGWRKTGSILFLENQTTDWDHPKFVPQVVDARHGTIHVPVADLNGDGKPDFVALISQEHETVVAFLNEGDGHFRPETIFTGPHPAYGSSGIQLVDFDGDGDLDVLYTNGDVLDQPYLLKPYHGVQWLENRGTFPFVHHPITPMYGVHRAVAADFTGTGRKDIVAVSFLPQEGYPKRKEQALDAFLYLERTGPDRFARHSLEAGTCDHVTCAVGDVYGSGRNDVVVGHFSSDRDDPAITIWKNLGPAGTQKADAGTR